MKGELQERGATGTGLMPSAVPEWLFLDLNSYFASVEQQENPRLRGRPIAVVPVQTDSTCAIAASYQAKAFGIKTGTMIYEARRLCPQLRIVVANHDLYVDYHHKILEVIGQHIPVTIVASIDEVACKLEGSMRSVENALALAQRIKRSLKESIGPAITCSIGLAPNRFLAKVASDMQKPDGLVLIERDTIGEQLGSLELKDLPGVGRNMEIRLKRAGILTMPDLLRASCRRLRNVWGGVEGERFYYKLRGVEIPEQPTSRRTVGHSHVLAPELRPPSMAELVARRLALKAASRLRRLGYLARSLELSVRVEKGPRWSEGITFPPANDSPVLMKHLQVLWEKTRSVTHNFHIKKVSVTFHNLVPAGDLQQMELFPEKRTAVQASPEQRKRLSKAMDDLNRRFGRDTVSLGLLPKAARGFSGTKVAFTRIPDKAEFHE